VRLRFRTAADPSPASPEELNEDEGQFFSSSTFQLITGVVGGWDSSGGMVLTRRRGDSFET